MGQLFEALDQRFMLFGSSSLIPNKRNQHGGYGTCDKVNAAVSSDLFNDSLGFDFLNIARAWPTLTDAIRSDITAIIESTRAT
jgi:hypothetical protein